jgi:hypothetical protein
MMYLRTLRLLFWTALSTLVAAGPATTPSASPPQTGEITLNFTQRSPLSAFKQLAPRLSSKETELGPDYDLSTYTFRTYVPPNYDPKTAYGIFIYLGNHDVNKVPPLWEPLFDTDHMIYITPDWHTPQPEVQLMGLSFDAVDNLKRLYSIDSHRIYAMFFNSGSLPMAIGGADVYTGIIIGEDWNYYRKIEVPSKHGFYAAKFDRPPADLIRAAQPHGIVLISMTGDAYAGAPLLEAALKQDGYTNVLHIEEPYDQVHYPYVAGWITDPVLPFLDKAAREAASAPNSALAATRPAAVGNAADATHRSLTPQNASASSAPAAPTGSADAQHLLKMAKLFIDNGNPDLARAKLRTLLATYPKDPTAGPAKKLLDSLPAAGAVGQ